MPLRAVAIAICVGVLFGGNQVASKIALQQFSPLFCAALAFTFSSMALGIYLGLYKKEQILFSPHIWRLHIISASLFFSFNLIALIGLNLTLASRASIFIAVHPFFVVLFNYFTAKKEQLSWQKLLGLCLILIGVLIVFRDRFEPLLGASWIGDILIILASALLGLTILHIRTVTNYLSPFQATFWQISLCVPAFWVTAFIFESPLQLPLFSPSWWGIIYMGLLVNAIAFVIRAELFRRYNTNTVSVFLFISPITGLFLSYFLLKEPITWTITWGSILIIFGIFLVYYFTPL